MAEDDHIEDKTNQCTATAKSTGKRCQQSAVPGTNVCRFHGGSAPQVEEKAQERLDRMADEVTAKFEDKLDDLMGEYDRSEDRDEKVKMFREMRQVLTDILDRTGHGPSEKREHDVDADVSGDMSININHEHVGED